MNRALHREEQALRKEARFEARHGHYGAAAHMRQEANMVHNEREHLIHDRQHHGHGHHGHHHHPEPVHHHHGNGHHGHHHHPEPVHHHHPHHHHGHHRNDGCCTVL